MEERDDNVPTEERDETDLRDNPAEEQDPGSHAASDPPSEEDAEGKIHDL